MAYFRFLLVFLAVISAPADHAAAQVTASDLREFIRSDEFTKRFRLAPPSVERIPLGDGRQGISFEPGGLTQSWDVVQGNPVLSAAFESMAMIESVRRYRRLPHQQEFWSTSLETADGIVNEFLDATLQQPPPPDEQWLVAASLREKVHESLQDPVERYASQIGIAYVKTQEAPAKGWFGNEPDALYAIHGSDFSPTTSVAKSALVPLQNPSVSYLISFQPKGPTQAPGGWRPSIRFDVQRGLDVFYVPALEKMLYDFLTKKMRSGIREPTWNQALHGTEIDLFGYYFFKVERGNQPVYSTRDPVSIAGRKIIRCYGNQIELVNQR